MRNILILMSNEFKSFVLTKSFLLTTIGLPLFSFFIVMMPTIVNKFESQEDPKLLQQKQNIVIVDEKSILNKSTIVDKSFNLIYENKSDSFKMRLKNKEIDAYIFIKELSKDKIEIEINSNKVERFVHLKDVLKKSIQDEKFKAFNLNSDKVKTIFNSVEFVDNVIDIEGKSLSQEHIKLYSIGISLIVYMILIMYGAAIMKSVFDEKESKIIEVLLSSVTTRQYLVGKITGTLLAAFLQFVVWTLSYQLLKLIFVFTYISSKNVSLNISSVEISNHFSFGIIIVYALISLIALCQYIFLYVILGSWAKTKEETQQLIAGPILLTMLPLLMNQVITKMPDSLLVKVMSYIPFVSGQVIISRSIASSITNNEFMLVIICNLMFLAFLSWFSERVLRVSLVSNTRKSLKSILRIFKESKI